MHGFAGWRWRNVPLPEPHLAGLGAGFLSHIIVPWQLFRSAWVGHALGWPLLSAGLWLAGWAVRAAANVDVARPDQLVHRRPYTFSRNPMYIAWTLLYAAIALLANAAWPLLLLPAVLLATHLVIVREERFLERRFGAAYRGYKASVRRYL